MLAKNCQKWQFLLTSKLPKMANEHSSGQDMVPPVQQLHKLLIVHSTSHGGLTAEDINLAADKLGTQQLVSDSIKWALMG